MYKCGDKRKAKYMAYFIFFINNWTKCHFYQVTSFIQSALLNTFMADIGINKNILRLPFLEAL